MYLLVGLGNPGKEYENTRHNVGFMVINKIAQDYNFSNASNKFNSLIYSGEIGGEKVILTKPQTYMNNSGNAVGQIFKYYKLDINNIIVFQDELDIITARIKMKKGGGAGGHNGIKSIDNHIGKDYWRIRIGIDHPGDKDEVSNYVLGNFSKQERILIDETLEDTSRHISYLLSENKEEFLTQLNK
ncbi:MAG: aminoacyl-tRNA hydrolase [Alphaproteobacteria bacterium]